MSEQQKFFASVSGAVVAHLLLLVLVFLMLSAPRIESSVVRENDAQRNDPKEVTIIMGDLMDRLEVEPPVPESDVEMARPFMSTDLNRPEDEAPENARFESDRNTSAASELAPDLSKPQQEGLTLKGDDKFPIFELENREYTDGEIGQAPSMAAGAAQSAARPESLALPPAAGRRAENEGDDLPNPEAKNGEDVENAVGRDSDPIEPVADQRMRPNGTVSEADPSEETIARSFVDPNGAPDAPVMRMAEGEEDQFADSSEEDGEVGNKADLAKEKEMAASRVGNDGESELTEETEQTTKPEMTTVDADSGIFAEGFSRERLQSSMNGTLTNSGQNAVDAEETAIGKYKQSVHDAIGQTWYRYHTKYRDSVTWGVLKLKFRVDSRGNVQGLRVVKNEANTLMTEFSLEAVLDAEIPAMPKEVSDELGIGGLDLDYDFIIY
tara:strand:- start:1050 stop:2366 length:1317 start_codon:yes stop_codon:yes gene_type:complete